MPRRCPPPVPCQAGCSARNITARFVGRSGPATMTGTSGGSASMTRSTSGMPAMTRPALSMPPRRRPPPPVSTMAVHAAARSAGVIAASLPSARSRSHVPQGAAPRLDELAWDCSRGVHMRVSRRTEIVLGLVVPLLVLVGLVVLGRSSDQAAVCVAFMAAVPMFAAMFTGAAFTGDRGRSDPRRGTGDVRVRLRHGLLRRRPDPDRRHRRGGCGGDRQPDEGRGRRAST